MSKNRTTTKNQIFITKFTLILPLSHSILNIWNEYIDLKNKHKLMKECKKSR